VSGGPRNHTTLHCGSYAKRALMLVWPTPTILWTFNTLWQMRAHVQRTPTDPNTGWDLNDNKAVDLPSRTPPAQGEGD